MSTVFYTATSLDGFIADAQNSLEWLFQFGPLEPNTFDDFLAGVGAIAMGSTTYQWLYDHQIAPTDHDPQPWPYAVPTWVFTSRQLPLVPGADVRFVRGDVRPVHQAMAIAAGDKTRWIVGGGDLAGQFYDAGLLDEIIVQVAPTDHPGKRRAPLSATHPSPASVARGQSLWRHVCGAALPGAHEPLKNSVVRDRVA